ncbi:DUF4153 domain-containing protein [Butyrivibrio sp. LB2008]|uniref:DUF4153 domain-containing protein n=1 Tax=Butyrivibrio sp. LB2008 TaxID=1408305 RepID=UPI00047CA327|nr:DUF4153 domain-containing protein [Butyrivibrio sp. LB2008]
MLGLKKIKNGFVEIVKEHPVSVISMLISMFFYSIVVSWNYPDFVLECFINFFALFFLIFALSALPCEAYRLYKRKSDANYSFKDKKNMIINISVMSVGTVLNFFSSGLYSFRGLKYFDDIGIDDLTYNLFAEYMYRFTTCFVVAAICASLYFFLKKSECSFETYTAKAFCGLMKAELVFLVIFIGLTLIIGAFSALIVEVDFDIYERLWVLLIGVVQYPCILMGLSKTDDEISKFGKIMLNYVLTGLLAIAFLIIYAYIVKTIIKWKFPLYMVFGILTTLFCFGVFIWTMAQGICEDNLRKFFRIMPLLFIPCIVMEILSLGRQIHIYGLTLARYAGIAAIVFEIAYFVLYVYNMKKEKNAMSVVFGIIVAVACVSLLAPGINAYSAVIASHKGKLMKYLANEDIASYHAACEAYRTIAYSCGAVGENYIDKKLSVEQKEKMIELAGDDADDKNEYFHASASRNTKKSVDISGSYEKMYNAYVYKTGDECKDDSYVFEVYDGEYGDDNNEMIGTVDLTAIITELVKLDEYGEDDKKAAIIDAPLDLNEGGKLIIEYIHIEGTKVKDDNRDIDEISLHGYVLK